MGGSFREAKLLLEEERSTGREGRERGEDGEMPALNCTALGPCAVFLGEIVVAPPRNTAQRFYLQG